MTRVYVGRLSYDVRERDLERFFKGYGRIREILLKNGFGFVEFEDYHDADDAVYELNGKELLGERVIVEIARGPTRKPSQYGYRKKNNWMDKYGPPTRTEYRVIVQNLSSRDLKDYMRQAGEVTYADAHKKRRNEGVIEFASYNDMKNAVEKLDGTELNGRRIKLAVDKSVKRRGRSRSNSHSHSRSRSRSRSRSPRRSRSRSRSNSRRSQSNSRSRSASRSPPPKKSRSPSRSRSASPERDGSQSPEKSNEPHDVEEYQDE